MNKQQAKGNWKVMKGRLKQAYGELTDDDLRKIEGDMDEAAGVIQKRTGKAREEVERELEDLKRSD